MFLVMRLSGFVSGSIVGGLSSIVVCGVILVGPFGVMLLFGYGFVKGCVCLFVGLFGSFAFLVLLLFCPVPVCAEAEEGYAEQEGYQI